jgi:hypothetical protein
MLRESAPVAEESVMLNRALPVVAVVSCVLADPVLGQSRTIIADRANNALWTLTDLDFSGTVVEPTETTRFFDATNAAGTLGPQNPTCLAVRCDGLVVMGDQINQVIYLFRDLNNDGDALDVGESRVVAGAGNAAGVAFAFPTGAAFDDLGRLYIVNASNASGDDAIYRLVDLNNNGDFMDADEITVYVGPGSFGGTRTNFSPQEIFFAGSTLVLRNSNPNAPSMHGIYTAIDANNDADADDPGEFTYFGHTATSGIASSAGFATEPDRFHEGSIYDLQLATGGVDQLVRLTDLNNDGDALDSGEAVLVYSTAETGFTSVDILSLPTGEVYMTDNSTKRVVVLRDLDADGDFLDPGERTNLLAAMGGVVGDIRQIVHFTACKADVTGDDGVTIDDLLLYLATFEAGGFCADLDDGNGTGTPDGGVTIDDLLYYLQRFEAGC